MRRLTCLLIALFLATAAQALARADTLDAGFGRHGVTLLGRAGADFGAGAVRLMSDRRVLAAGTDGPGFLVARLRASGTPDPSFGRRGRLSVHFPGASRASARGVALFRDGRIVVAGTVAIGGVRRLAVTRLLPGGHLDPNFGSDGIRLAGPPDAQLEAMALQPEGEIVLAGSTPAGARRAPLVMRLLPDGTPDRRFGTRGVLD